MALALVVLAGCGDSPGERTGQLDEALRGLDGVDRVEMSTPSGEFTRDVHAVVYVDGVIDRATYERVAEAYQAYGAEEDPGMFARRAEAWVEGTNGRAVVPADPGTSDAVAGWVDALSDEGPPLVQYELTHGTDLGVELVTTDPLATARRLALDGYGNEPQTVPSRLVAGRPFADPSDPEPGVASIQLRLGDEGAARELEALGRAQDKAGASATLTLLDGELTVVTEGDDPATVRARHEAVSEVACPAVEVETRSGETTMSGCDATAPVR